MHFDNGIEIILENDEKKQIHFRIRKWKDLPQEGNRVIVAVPKTKTVRKEGCLYIKRYILLKQNK